jgi:sterol desaturase/sphingolipid hydroxylase (fatty acid hydroxylase superfamily)
MFLEPSNSAIASLVVMSIAFLAIALAESELSPSAAEGKRLTANFGLGVTNGLLALALPAGNAAASIYARERGWGVLGLWNLPWTAGTILLLLTRSLSTYGLHRCSHSVPVLWRIHRVHHSDERCDLSTSFRSHPLEAMIGFPLAIAVTAFVGPRIGQLITVETLLLSIAMWEHGQVRSRPVVEKWVGLVVPTPSQHRLHHSADPLHYNCNFGDGLILWDRLFGTYATGRQPERYGVSECPQGGGYSHLLTQPFRHTPNK